MRICFIMYPWEKIEPNTDSTLRLIHECVKRQHSIELCKDNSSIIEYLIKGIR